MSARDELATDLHLTIKALGNSADNRMMVCSSADRAQIVDAILAAGYTKRPATPLKRVRGELKSLGKHIDSWESEGHSTVTLRFMRQWIASLEAIARDKA